MKTSKILSALFIISLPFQENIYVGGLSISFILMSVLSLYVFFTHLGNFNFIVKHSKIFRYFFVFLIGIAVIEFFHPNSALKNIFRSFFFIIGSVLLATLLINKNGIRFIAQMYVISGLLVAFNLVYNGYGLLLNGQATSTYESNLVRDQIGKEVSILQDLNNLAFNLGLSALMASGFIIFSKEKKNRKYFVIVLVITFIGMIVTMSRGALLTVIVTILFFSFYFKIGGVKKFLIPIIFASLILYLVPATYFSRFNIDLSRNASESDARSLVFNASTNAILEEGLFGVGEGNFWSEWGRNSEFARDGWNRVRVLGTHNLFFQIIINWGIIGFALFSLVLSKVYSFMPKRTDITLDSFLFVVIFVSGLLYMAQIHNLNTKDFMILFSVGIIQEMEKRINIIKS